MNCKACSCSHFFVNMHVDFFKISSCLNQACVPLTGQTTNWTVPPSSISLVAHRASRSACQRLRVEGAVRMFGVPSASASERMPPCPPCHCRRQQSSDRPPQRKQQQHRSLSLQQRQERFCQRRRMMLPSCPTPLLPWPWPAPRRPRTRGGPRPPPMPRREVCLHLSVPHRNASNRRHR